MERIPRWAIVLGIMLAVCAGEAGAAVLLGDAPSALIPSAPPALLGPITEDGRVGWQCAPERAARATTPHDADLPSE